MDDSIEGLTRRTFFLAGAIGTLSLAAVAGDAETVDAPAAGQEKANVKLVEDFIKSWGATDAESVMHSSSYLADDATLRMFEDKPPVIGPAAYAAGFKSFISDGSRISVKILQTFAKGPMVANSRVDTVTAPGKPDQIIKVAGVFIVKNGKIKEWDDYLTS
jgi:limonene-1,2-epoxide hydrolase